MAKIDLQSPVLVLSRHGDGKVIRNLCIVIGQGHHSAKDCTKAIGEIFCVTQNRHFVFQECVRRWTSLLHHICGVHRWEEPGVEHTSHHAPLTEEEQRKKR